MNTDNLPLFYYPSTWIYVDDDKNLLHTMKIVLSEINTVKLFQSSVDCLKSIENYEQPSTKFSFLKNITDDEKYGVLNHTPIDFDVTDIPKLVDKEDRYNEISVVIIDYNMPEIDGFSLAEKIHSFSAKKLLLTGKAETEQAIKAFNDHLIQSYVKKFDDCMEEKLIVYLKSLTYKYFQTLTAPLLSYLETDHKLPQSDPIFINFFKSFCEKNNIVEYYLIDKQGSLLLINNKREYFCLAMQSDETINSWLSFYTSEITIPDNVLTAIQTKKMMLFLGIGRDLWQSQNIDWNKHLYPSNILEGREKYFWSVINLS